MKKRGQIFTSKPDVRLFRCHQRFWAVPLSYKEEETKDQIQDAEKRGLFSTHYVYYKGILLRIQAKFNEDLLSANSLRLIHPTNCGVVEVRYC